jgi:lipopolysaccharide export system protein LptC
VNPFRRLRPWLRDRRLPAAIVLMALAVGAVQTLQWWLAPAPKVSDFVGPPRSGYTLGNFRGVVYDKDGLPSFRIAGPHLERREGDESLYLNAPTFELPAKQPGVPDWHGQSEYGWVDKSGNLIKLQGPVHMHRPAYGDTAAADIRTSEVTAWPKENRMETAEPAQLVQGASTMSGVGMRANLNDKHLELLHDVRATFPPRQRKPA